jgi:hypothetical protein
MTKLSPVILTLATVAFGSLRATAQTTIFFHGSGAENGITERGTRSFSFMGSNWSGGVVDTEGITRLYASGSFSYEIEGGGGMVTFDQPVESVRFFYVHGSGFDAGTATAFDASGTVVGMAASRQATFFNDQNNFVLIESGTPIARIEFSAGVIDNFTFTAAAAATPTTTDTPTVPPTATPSPSPEDTASPTATPTPSFTPRPGPCVGDCNSDAFVTVDELVLSIGIALEVVALDHCREIDFDLDDRVTIDEVVSAVAAATNGCVAALGSDAR